MALSTQEFLKLKSTLAAKQRVVVEQGTKPQSFLAETGQDIKQIGTDVVSSAKTRSSNLGESIEAMKKGEQGLGRTVLQGLGQTFGAVSDTFGAITKGAVKAVLPQGAETAIKSGIESVATPILQSKTAQDIMAMYQTLDPKTQRDISAALGAGSLALDVSGVGVAGKGAKVGVQTAKNVASKGAKLASEAVDTGIDLTKKGVALVKPKPLTGLKAAGQILQGETSDIASGIKSFAKLNTSGVKTYSELGKRIVDKITELAKKVDTELLKDTKLRKLSQLATDVPTATGVVKYNYVRDAIDELKNYYTSIKDIKKLSQIQKYADALDPINGSGITLKDVNDIARMHGSDLNAFNASGELASGLTKQAAENTRQGLKETTRQLMPNTVAKNADKLSSTLQNTKKLIDKNIEAVNKLKQRIQDRGILAKVGAAAAKYGDILTGGSVRGFIGGLLPRGAGYKVMNALDLEEALMKNLEILQKAIDSGSEKEIVNILKGISNVKK